MTREEFWIDMRSRLLARTNEYEAWVERLQDNGFVTWLASKSLMIGLKPALKPTGRVSLLGLCPHRGAFTSEHLSDVGGPRRQFRDIDWSDIDSKTFLREYWRRMNSIDKRFGLQGMRHTSEVDRVPLTELCARLGQVFDVLHVTKLRFEAISAK